MTQPISNLVATWIPGTGIQLTWTPAPDDSNVSHYEIYALENVLSYTPSWNLIGTSLPLTTASGYASNSQATATIGVYPPASSFVVPLSTMATLFASGGVAPTSLAFSVIHRIDASNVASTAVSVSAFQQPKNQAFGAPHLTNNIALDPFGQFTTTAQDSYSEIANSVGMFLGTIKGQRTVVPNYGVDDMPLNQLDVTQIQSDLNKAEDRANALVDVTYDAYNNATLSVRVQAGQGGIQ